MPDDQLQYVQVGDNDWVSFPAAMSDAEIESALGGSQSAPTTAVQKNKDDRLMRDLSHRFAIPQSTPEGDPDVADMYRRDPGFLAAESVGNVLPSAWNLAKSIPAIAAKVGNAAQNPMAQIELVGDMASGLKERFGGASNIRNTIATDPVGLAADVAGGVGAGSALRRSVPAITASLPGKAAMAARAVDAGGALMQGRYFKAAKDAVFGGGMASQAEKMMRGSTGAATAPKVTPPPLPENAIVAGQLGLDTPEAVAMRSMANQEVSPGVVDTGASKGFSRPSTLKQHRLAPTPMPEPPSRATLRIGEPPPRPMPSHDAPVGPTTIVDELKARNTPPVDPNDPLRPIYTPENDVLSARAMESSRAHIYNPTESRPTVIAEADEAARAFRKAVEKHKKPLNLPPDIQTFLEDFMRKDKTKSQRKLATEKDEMLRKRREGKP